MRCDDVIFVTFLLCVSLSPSTAIYGLKRMSRIRSNTLRAVYHKLQDDALHRNDTHEYWYTINRAMLPADMCDLAVEFDEDEESRQFLDQCYEKSDWIFTQLGHSLAKSFLSWFMTSTSINGWLQRGSMFVFSDNQLKELLQITDTYRGNSMIDLGAGDGKVTEKMAKYFDTVYATEVSSTMVWRLEEKGYKILGLEEWSNGTRQYDLIGCLNLLDRCDKPMSVLSAIRNSLSPSGRAIVAVVLPFQPYVELNYKNHNKPTENLIIHGNTFEDQCTCFIRNVFEPAGFIVERFTRLPYLCEGDLHQSFYVLNDAVFVIRRKENG